MEKVKGVADESPSLIDGAASRPPREPAWHAPSSPVPAPPPPVVTETDVLDELVVTVANVRGALLASVDGFGLARNRSLPDEPSHPAMLAAAVGLAHQLVDMGNGTELRQLVVDHDGGLLLIWPIGTQRVLAVLAASNIDQHKLRLFVQSRAHVITGAGS